MSWNLALLLKTSTLVIIYSFKQLDAATLVRGVRTRYYIHYNGQTMSSQYQNILSDNIPLLHFDKNGMFQFLAKIFTYETGKDIMS